MSQTIREQILVEENHRRSMAALPHAYRPSTALTLPPLEEAPHFMRETMSFISLVSSTPVKPRVHPSQIKEVDWEHKPRYMQETQSFRQKLEKEEQRRHVSPKEIKEVDWKNKPRYMEPTKAYRQSIAPVEEYHPRRVKPSQIKPVDTGRLPRYMQLTKATQAMQAVQATQDAKPAQQSTRSVTKTVTRQPTNATAKPLPNFMRSTKSCQSSLDNRLREEEARRKKKEERDHQQEELKALQNRWKRNQETLQSLREKK